MTDLAEIAPFDPSLPDLITDPYPIFARIREGDPFHWSKLGYWVVSRYDHVREVLMNRKDFGTGDFAQNLKLLDVGARFHHVCGVRTWTYGTDAPYRSHQQMLAAGLAAGKGD